MAAGRLSSPGSSGSGTTADVEALIAEAADLVALEQIAKLNTAHLADGALLPADVESRFRRLKTFPAAFSETRAAPAPPCRQASDKGVGAPGPAADAEQPPPAEPVEAKIYESDLPVDKDVILTAATTPVKSGGANGSDSRSGSGLLTSPTISAAAASSSSSRGSSPSPPRGRGCCFAFSPRKSNSRKKGARDVGAMMGFNKEEDNCLFSDLGTLSLSDQRRSMRKWQREEEKVAQEEQRMVKWIKQASARMEVSAATVEELLSDLEDEGNSK